MVTIVYSHHDGESAIPSDFVDELRAVIGEYTKKLGLYKIGKLQVEFEQL